MIFRRVFFAFIILGTMAPWASYAGQAAIEISPRTSTPGATVVLSGKGLGQFKSVQFNKVTFAGMPALIQRWESDLVEVKVPFKATTGPVEMMIGKKKLSAGTFTVVKPRIESITPTEAERGTMVTITGEHFGATAGARDPNTMFGVNDVVIGGVVVRPRRWKDDKIEVEIPTNAAPGDVVVRLASSDPLADGSCCAPVEYVTSNAVSLALVPSVRVDPMTGPVGTKVVLFGQGFGTKGADDAVRDRNQSRDDRPVERRCHCRACAARSGNWTAGAEAAREGTGAGHVYRACAQGHARLAGQRSDRDLLRINGEHFGFYSESGSTPYSFMDFNKGENRVEIGGVPAVIYRWNDDRIDVWVPFSVKSGPVRIYRSANKPKADGSCCQERGELVTEAGTFTLVTPVVESYEPKSAGLDDLVTIKGKGFGTFLKTAEHTGLELSQKAYKRRLDVEINEPESSGSTVISNVSRTEVLFNGAAALVQSWTDTEIVVKVPHRNLYGIGKRGAFFDDLSTGPLVVRRGSWDVLAGRDLLHAEAMADH